ncbi:MAG: tRNA (guanosine(37)-N1)-methyltransferase TrmD [Legionellales bacterium]|nr:tRNA (guanosine(37)-N1)-methyltransferase TrmD [Legionellales bacterium]
MTSNLPLKVNIITLFPEMFSALHYGIVGRAIESGQLEYCCLNPREHTQNRNGYIDDSPYGGGPGMIMQAEPILACIDIARQQLPKAFTILLTPSGHRVEQHTLQHLNSHHELIIICGRYEGIDARLTRLTRIDAELSLGDFVLSGGEIAAMALIDSCARQRPNVLGHPEGATDDSFSDGLLEAPQYTRPKTLENQTVPGVLLSGNHADIRQWRRQQALGRTWRYRPDLLEKLELDTADQALLLDYQQTFREGEQT